MAKDKQTAERIKQAIIQVYHQNCPASITSEKFPHIGMRQLSPVVTFNEKKNSLDYKILWGISADTPGELDEFLNFLKKYARTRALYVLDRGKTSAIIFHSVHGPSSSYDRVLKTGAMYSGNIDMVAGYEVHPILTTNPSQLQKLLGELSSVGEIKVARVGNYKSPEEELGLTLKQRDALKIAVEGGYYKWPRNSNLEDLAKVAKVSRRSLQERLRRAEVKLLPYAAKEFLKKHF